MEEKKKRVYINDKRAINKWVYFTFNYPYDFIERCWADNPMLASHIRDKFSSYGYDLNRLYCELDSGNMNRLLDWVMENYKDEIKVFG